MGRPSASKSRVSMGLFSPPQSTFPKQCCHQIPFAHGGYTSIHTSRSHLWCDPKSFATKKGWGEPTQFVYVSKKTFKSSSIAWSHIKSYSPLSLSLSLSAELELSWPVQGICRDILTISGDMLPPTKIENGQSYLIEINHQVSAKCHQSHPSIKVNMFAILCHNATIFLRVNTMTCIIFCRWEYMRNPNPHELPMKSSRPPP